MTSHTGSCLCGNIAWTFSGTPDAAYHCHCAMCRKAHGAAFGTYYFVPADRFSWTGSNDTLVAYESSPGVERAFCSKCGSMVPSGGERGESVAIPAGSHTHGPGASAHIFVASKAPWHRITDALPQYEEFSPSEEGTVIADRELPPRPDGVVARGSCLCGAVAFEVLEPFKVVHNCHCSRCRRARAAAFTTNGFTSADGVRFTRGEEHLRIYKPPEASRFTHAFCDRCGSGLPRINREHGYATIPLGALDDDPGQGPVDHIYVDDKADWYEIGDTLPCFPQGPG